MLQFNKILILLFLPLLSLAADKIIIDLKVPLTETTDLTPAQVGATVYLMKADWASVSEVGEDVAVWLTGYDRKKNFLGQQVISLKMELREPSSIRLGNLIQTKKSQSVIGLLLQSQTNINSSF